MGAPCRHTIIVITVNMVVMIFLVIVCIFQLFLVLFHFSVCDGKECDNTEKGYFNQQSNRLLVRIHNTGWLNGRTDRRTNGWMDVKVVLRIAYTNQKYG